MKEQLIQHLLYKGKTHSWVEIYNMFPFKGNLSNKKKSDTIRKLYNRLYKNIPSLSNYEEFQINNKLENPKVLFLDIETAPLVAYLWSIWNQNVNPLNGQLSKDWFILCWSAFFLDNPTKILSSKLTPEEVKEENDKRCLIELWKHLNEADYLIHYNGDKFDIKRINTRFLLNHISPPSPSYSIDLIKVVKKQFDFTSFKLDFILRKLNIGKKLPTNMMTWVNCMRGDKNALEYMSEYCDIDTLNLLPLYKRLIPFMTNHPIFYKEGCHVCGTDNLTSFGKYRTKLNVYESDRCNNCGTLSRKGIKHQRSLR